MKKTNLLKTLSIVAMASTLVACGKTKTVKEEWTDEEKVAWAEENGYEQWTQAEKDAYAEQWAEDNGYVVPEVELDYDNVPTLEVAFGDTYSTVDSKNLMGKLNYKQNFALVIGGSTCTGCSTLKNDGILDAFVEQTGYKLYYWTYDTDANYLAYATQDETAQAANAAAKILKAVYGSMDAIFTTPTLVAFTEPTSNTATMSAVAATWDVTGNSAAQIKEKLETVYTFETEEFTEFRSKADLSQIKTAGNLVKEIASGDASIMFFSRYGCGSCQVLQNTATHWNFITRLFKDITIEDGENFKFIAVISEDIQNSVVDASGTTFFNGVKAVYDRAVANPDLSDEAKITWFKTTNVLWNATEGKWTSATGSALAFSGDRYNELVMYAVALGQIKVTPSMVTNEGYLTEAFWTAIETWVNSDSEALEAALGTQVIDTSKGSSKLYQGERLIPAFLAVNYQEWSNEYAVVKPSSNDQNAPINNFYDLPRELGVKTTGATGYAEFVDYLYARTKMYIETWFKYGEAMTAE